MTDGRITLHRSRPRGDREYELSRRRFMQLVGASAAVSFASGCAPDVPEKILPYVRRPPDVTPGKPTHYATSLAIDGFATGLIVETREGRPIKVEGNPAHPSSLGATSIYHQAAVLQLYDPDRGRGVCRRGQPEAWSAIEAMLRVERSDRGAGLRLVLEPTSSPLLAAQLEAIKHRHPASKITFYSALPSQAPGEASELSFGERLAPQYDLTAARVIVALDSDLLANPFELRYARQFGAGRHLADPHAEMNRLYAIEAAMSVTGSMADHRLRRPSRKIPPLTAALASDLLGERLPRAERYAIERQLDREEKRFVAALSRDLRERAPGQSLVVVGERQPVEVHALGYAINAQLGNLGSSLRFTPQAVPDRAGDQDLAALAHEMRNGAVDTLVVFGANPSYDALPDLGWASACRRVAHTIYCGMYYNETAADAAWFAPLLHPFEAWSDGRAYDGTLSFAQPLIKPLFDGKSVSELLGMLANEPNVGDHARLRVRFGEPFGEGLTLAMSPAERSARERPDVRAAWESSLSRGFVEASAFAATTPSLREQGVRDAFSAIVARPPSAAGLELNLLRSPTLHDGRYANVSWLLELPDSITKLTWDNALLMSPLSAARLGLPAAAPDDDDRYPVVELRHAGRTLRAPLLCLPSHAEDSVSIWLGYGRGGAERLASGVGVNAYPLRTIGAEHFASGAELVATGERYPLAITQPHRQMRDRPLALTTTLAAYREQPTFTAEQKGPVASLLPDFPLPGPQWAMTIDLGMCIGCNACVVACQAENNIMVVGKEQVRRGRVMHWIRIDAYDSGDRLVHQPMLCQHCEKAPCEYVCPVNATEHSPDGLNEMVYNRCIGTRFCSNNCPYKVRRFNWFDWTKEQAANGGEVALQRNPEVSVRARGVMEKCTYCVQRIRAAEIDARIEHREIRAGEVVTACQQACPTGAIAFGSLTDPNTAMSNWRREARSYAALHETGARPRTMYLARIDNPNPKLG